VFNKFQDITRIPGNNKTKIVMKSQILQQLSIGLGNSPDLRKNLFCYTFWYAEQVMTQKMGYFQTSLKNIGLSPSIIWETGL
jgi:hypothetical protein